MFAVIKTGGKQYKVKVGDILQVEKLDAEEGQNIAFNQVLLIEHEEETMIGTPFIEKALVNAEVIANFKDKKVIVFKKKRRKQYKKKRGHRQELTRIKIEEIVSDMKVSPKKKPAPVNPLVILRAKISALVNSKRQLMGRQPQTEEIEWRKYLESKPKEFGEYLIQTKIGYQVVEYVEAYHKTTHGNFWKYSCFGDKYKIDKAVIAWAEIPRGYKE